MPAPSTDWRAAFDVWVALFLEALRYHRQRHWAALYLRGLLLPGERKSIEPLAARVARHDV